MDAEAQSSVYRGSWVPVIPERKITNCPGDDPSPETQSATREIIPERPLATPDSLKSRDKHNYTQHELPPTINGADPNLPCPFDQYGCRVSGHRRELREHATDPTVIGKHMAMLAKTLSHQQSTLQNFQDVVVGLGDKGVRSPSGAISPNSLSPNYLKAQANSPAKSKASQSGDRIGTRQQIIAQETAIQLEALMQDQIQDIQQNIQEAMEQMEQRNQDTLGTTLDNRIEPLQRHHQQEQGNLRKQVISRMNDHIDAQLNRLEPSARSSLHTYSAATTNSAPSLPVHASPRPPPQHTTAQTTPSSPQTFAREKHESDSKRYEPPEPFLCSPRSSNGGDCRLM